MKILILFTIISCVFSMDKKQKLLIKNAEEGTQMFRNLKYTVQGKRVVKKKMYDMVDTVLKGMEDRIGELKTNMETKFERLGDVFNKQGPLNLL